MHNVFVILLSTSNLITIYFRGFVKLKKSKNTKKTRKWVVGQAPARIIIFFEILCFLSFCVVLCFQMFKKKKLARGVGGWGVNNPSFSLFF